MQVSIPKLHTPRLIARHKTLSKVFDEKAMEKVWKKYVRPGLRNQEILDLFDYNDFHWNRIERFSDLKKSIVSGNYNAKPAIPTKIEKKYGICRTIVTPLPEDSIVLQCIVESILPEALKKQPSKNTFFSRSHGLPEVDVTYHRDYIWFKQWRKFSKMRFRVSSAKGCVAVTDISTFFDNVDYANLRNIISSRLTVNEAILDVLFKVLDTISWRPDFLPSRQVGLPQVQFDAPRLLAHIYLFEVDEYLKSRVGSHFVRWVDDITVGCDSPSFAKSILRDLDAILHMRGLRLNSGKTIILSSSEATAFFWQAENDYFDVFEAAAKTSTLTGRQRGLAKRKFSHLTAVAGSGMWGKVVKRYIGFFGKINDDYALDYCIKSFENHNDLRDSIYRYFSVMGYRPEIFAMIRRYLSRADNLDDASLSNLARVISEWPISPSTAPFRAVTKLAKEVSTAAFIDNHPSRFLFALWISAKFARQREIFDLLERNYDLWGSSEFLSRQVAASLAKIRDKARFDRVSSVIASHGFRSAVSVVNTIRRLKGSTFPLAGDVYLYILNGRKVSNYGIARFLTIVAIFQSSKLTPANKNVLKVQIRKYMTDPHYLDVLDKL